MKTENSCEILRQVFADSQTLLKYLCGRLPEIQDIKRNLFLAERSFNYQKPDHYYKSLKEKVLPDTDNISDLLIKTLQSAACENLEIRDKRVWVKNKRFDIWQDLITMMPPLPLVSFALYKHICPPSYDIGKIYNYLNDYIKPNLTATTLPTLCYPKIEHFIKKTGLTEIHLHLNGTTEFDHVWLHALEHPYKFYKKCRYAKHDSSVKEQYEQIEPGITPKKIYDRIRLASLLRKMLSEWLFKGISFSLNRLKNISNLENMPFADYKNCFLWSKHPVKKMFPAFDKKNKNTLEGLFYIFAFRYLEDEHPPAFTHAMYLYLLLLGFFNKFLVQQIQQVGFDQFQKIANNECRSSVEDDYYHRFKQIAGQKQEDIRFVEGRFAPKKTFMQNVKILNKIMHGFAKFQGYNNYNPYRSDRISGSNRMELRLIAHFIKQKDDDFKNNVSATGLKVRHHSLRNNLEGCGRSLLDVITIIRGFKKYITGIDAAANELHAPPEVFAPLYRMFRRKGFVNFTYHVGEDFSHLLSGIRSIYEAVVFLNLQQGNRIGHATAIGLDPNLWLSAMEPNLILSNGEWLDNLVFAYHMLKNEDRCSPLLVKLRDKIESIASNIYKRPSIRVYTLIEAWKMRYLDPLIACNKSRVITEKTDLREREEWKFIENEEKRSPDAFKLFCNYHMEYYARGYEKKETIDLKLFDCNTLKILQNAVIKKLHEKDVVIEAMPTSNMRISFYDNYKKYHLWRWLGIDSNNKCDSDSQKNVILPTVCLGSDDPGIFATSLRNEYTHIYDQLINTLKQPHDKSMEIIKKLAKNADIYCFEKGIS